MTKILVRTSSIADNAKKFGLRLLIVRNVFDVG